MGLSHIAHLESRGGETVMSWFFETKGEIFIQDQWQSRVQLAYLT